MPSPLVTDQLLSDRYADDGLPLRPLSPGRASALTRLQQDPRLTKHRVHNCPVCGNGYAHLIARKDRDAVPLDTVVCDGCGLVRSLDQYDQASLDLLYGEYYRHYGDAPIDSDEVEARYALRGPTFVPRYLGRRHRIVEIGCGGGWDLVPFDRAGLDYLGFDYDEAFIELGRRKGLKLMTGGVETVAAMGIRADYLMLNQVLEHTLDPIAFLAATRAILKADAIVKVWVPPLDLIPFGYSRGDLLGTLQLAHNFLFDDVTLPLVAKRAGFRVLYCHACHIILQPSGSAEMPPPSLQRGAKVVRYLRAAESLLATKRRLGIAERDFSRLYYLKKPLNALRRATTVRPYF